MKFKEEDFQYSIRVLLEIADELNVPVMMNAVGIEGYDKDNYRCLKLKKAINRKCVRIITTRDSEVFLKKNFVYNQSIETAEVADSALWVPECFRLSRTETKYEVGINVTYLHLLSTYKIADDNILISFFSKLVERLELSGITFRLFCNGKKSDYEGALELCNRLNLSPEMLLPKADTAEELVRQIAIFKCIIPIRFHSCIIGYSLGCRSAGFIWNHKYDWFLEKTNMSKWFQNVKSVDFTKLVDSVQEAISNYGFPSELDVDKNNTFRYIVHFLRDHV